MQFKTGKKPATPGAVQLRFGTYYAVSKLQQPVGPFGKPWLVPGLMLGNDDAGDCVIVSGINGVMTACAMAGKPIPTFTTAVALSDYGAAAIASGDPPGWPNDDPGLDLLAGAKYRQQTGLADTTGTRHKIGIYTALDVERIKNGDLSELWLAMSMYFAVDLGVMLPPSAQDQFRNQQTWTVEPGEVGRDGHCTCGCGRNSKGQPYVRTWGGIQGMTPPWLSAFIDEGVVYVPLEVATAALLDDFNMVTS